MDVANVQDKVVNGRKKAGRREKVENVKVESRTKSERDGGKGQMSRQQGEREKDTRKDHGGIHGR